MSRAAELPPGVLTFRVGPGANCSSSGSAVDVLFYASVVAGAVAVALAAALPPRKEADADPEPSQGNVEREGDRD